MNQQVWFGKTAGHPPAGTVQHVSAPGAGASNMNAKGAERKVIDFTVDDPANRRFEVHLVGGGVEYVTYRSLDMLRPL